MNWLQVRQQSLLSVEAESSQASDECSAADAGLPMMIVEHTECESESTDTSSHAALPDVRSLHFTPLLLLLLLLLPHFLVSLMVLVHCSLCIYISVYMLRNLLTK